MKKLIASVLVCMMLLSACAPKTAPETTAPAGESLFTAGSYTSTSKNGMGGDVEVKVDFDAEKIVSIEVVKHNETPGISDKAVNEYPQSIVDAQSIEVDMVAGATVTSTAIYEAVKDCVMQAGGEAAVAALSVKPEEGNTEKEVVELNTQVAIVGGGATGIAAAVSCAEQGATDVIVLEKMSTIGGNAMVSGGYLEYISAPDELRPAMNDGYANIIESIIAADPMEMNPEADEAWVTSYKAFQETLSEEYEAYKATGNTGVFDSKTWLALDYLILEPYSTPESMYEFASLLDDTANWLTDLGMEWKPLTGIVGYTWPRWSSPMAGHQGKGYFDLFEKVISDKEFPVNIMTETAGKELIVEDGKVVGVVAESKDKIYNIRAEKGVVLATGGFAANNEMVQKYNTMWENLPADMPTTNIPGTTGDGIVMAEKVDAMVEMMDDIMLFPNADPFSSTTENVVGDDGDMCSVNKEGVRFIDETLDRYSLSGAILAQPDQIHYIISDAGNCKITDGKTFNGFDIETMIANGQLYRADSIEELATQLGMDPAVLTNTIEKYNTYAANFDDPEFGRKSFSDKSAIDEAPFYACPRSVATHITGGGLIRDEKYRVINNSGEVIPGLYAGGEITAYMSGISSFGDGMYIGQSIFGNN